MLSFESQEVMQSWGDVIQEKFGRGIVYVRVCIRACVLVCVL